MGEVVLVAVKNAFDHLPNHGASSGFLEVFEGRDVFEEIASLQVLHDDDNFHVFHGEALVDLDDVAVPEGLQNLGLYKDGVDVAD